MKKHLFTAAVALVTAAAVQADPPTNTPKGPAQAGTGHSAVAHPANTTNLAGGSVAVTHAATVTHANTVAHSATTAGANSWNTPKPTGYGGTPGKTTGPAKTNMPATSGWKPSTGATASSYQNYHLTHGKAFKGGYCYPGKNHTHWTYHGYSKKYGCECYWCPSTCQYYYWCESATCYYPVSYYQYAPCSSPAPTPCPEPAPSPCPSPTYVTYKVPVVTYSVAYKTVTVPVTGCTTTTQAACCQPAPCPTPAPYPTPAPALDGYGGQGDLAMGGAPGGLPAGVSPIPQ
jgi:hypothetical protein